MRSRTVIDLYFVNRMQAYGWPILVMVLALGIVLAVGAIVGTQGAEARAGMYEGMTWSGAIFSLLGPMIGYGFVSMGQYFPLALGLGLTRREFAIGQSLLFLGNALAYALLITIGKTLEVATGGFGLQIRFFDVFYTGTGASWQTFVQTFLLIVATLFLGAAITSAFLRFGQPFIWLGGSLLGILGVAMVAGIVLVDGFGAQLLELFTLGWGSWMGVIAVIGLLSAGTWLLLVRRTQVP
ncbi:hypothetical protein [Brachybacterium sp. FME24]|uniref:hypothetical protein n=1 Tax=Brachybacterium sp. FME24 TaxID=2742605 RepID=UPI0018663550|nr:hypothetical protein [Brachybacterium sp. FME24]